MFWQQVVFGRPRAAKNCKPVAKFKQDYSNNSVTMLKYIHDLYRLTVVNVFNCSIILYDKTLCTIKDK